MQELGGQTTNRLLRVVTRCATRAEFLATFDRFVDETSVFVATHQPRAVGARLPFAIALKDGEAVLKGEGEVIESHLEAGGAMKRPGMLLRFLRLDAPSREVLNELLERKRTHTPPPVPPAALVASTRKSTDRPVSAAYAPANETRVPGSSYIVPANPFGELRAEALEYFIECTLYEETSVQPPAAEPPSSQPVQPVPPATAVGSTSPLLGSGGTPIPTALSSLAASPPSPYAPSSAFTPPPELLVPASSRRGWMAVLAGIIGCGLGLAGGYALWAKDPGIPPTPTRTSAPPAASSNPAPTVEQHSDRVAAPPSGPARELAAVPSPVAVPSASGSGSGSASGSASGSGSESGSPSVDPPVSPGRSVDKKAEGSDVRAAPVTVGAPNAGGCRLTVVTDPLDAPVKIAGRAARRTPLAEIAVPCGDVTVTIDHPRYQRVERKVHVSPGEPARLEEHLERPSAVLALRSTPPGAAFSVNGARAGKGPTSAGVPGFTFVTVKASLEGYAPWSQRVYLRGTDVSLNAALEPVARAQGAQRPTGRRGRSPEL